MSVAGNRGSSRSRSCQQLANGAFYVLAVVIFLTVLSQLDIRVELLDRLILIACGSAAVGFALAFGLGSRDAMGSLATGQLLKSELQPGTQVSMNGQPATVQQVGLVYTTLQLGGRSVQVGAREIPVAEDERIIIRPG